MTTKGGVEEVAARTGLNAELKLDQILRADSLAVGIRLGFPDGGALERKAGARGLTIILRNGSRIELDGTTDFARLANDDLSRGKRILRISSTSDEYLNALVSGYYSEFEDSSLPWKGNQDLGGQSPAQNKRDSHSFNYLQAHQTWGDYEFEFLEAREGEFNRLGGAPAIERFAVFKEWLAKKEPAFYARNAYRLALSSKDLGGGKYKPWITFVGSECEATAVIDQFMSLGLVPPDYSREEFEARYTSLHSGPEAQSKAPPGIQELLGAGPPRLGPEYSKNFRNSSGGITASKRQADIAEILKKNDWARLTGAAQVRYVPQEVAPPYSLEDERTVASWLQKGYTVYRASRTHSTLVTGYAPPGRLAVDDPIDHGSTPRTGSDSSRAFNEDSVVHYNYLHACKPADRGAPCVR